MTNDEFASVPMMQEAIFAAIDAFTSYVPEIKDIPKDAEFMVRIMRAIAAYKIEEAKIKAGDAKH